MNKCDNFGDGFLHKTRNGKLQFIGQGLCPWTPLKPFLKEGFKNPKNFQKDISIIIF